MGDSEAANRLSSARRQIQIIEMIEQPVPDTDYRPALSPLPDSLRCPVARRKVGQLFIG
jgi:hypothetical protein